MAKILFTSGSTAMPKGVINTHGMLCANQQSLAQIWPFTAETPPVLVDWLPWNHTFGGNHNFNLILKRGGTMYIDAGRPAPPLIPITVRNLTEIAPTIYFNVPAGYGALLPFLERDADLRTRFFERLDLIFYAAAALPQDLWTRLENVAREARGEPVMMTSSWGLTETSPLATAAHFPIDRAGVIGVPVPGIEIKLAPVDDKLEMRVKGPKVTPGYVGDDEQTRKAFDEDGWYRTGDAGRLEDEDDPNKGLVFNGRVVEDFKLLTGTFVSVGNLRIAALAAASPLLMDAVVCGHDRDYVGLLAWLNVGAAKEIAGEPDAELPETWCARRSWPSSCASASPPTTATTRRPRRAIERVILLAEPPSLDANEITDKGYVNQRAALERRAAHGRSAVRRGPVGRGDPLSVGMPDVGAEYAVAEADCLDGVLGFEVVSIGDGEAVARFPIQDRVRQRFGLVHGGAYAALAEMIATEATVAHVYKDGFAAMGTSNDTSFLKRGARRVDHRDARAPATAAARRGCGRSTTPTTKGGCAP